MLIFYLVSFVPFVVFQGIALFLCKLLLMLVCVALLTAAERKVLGVIQGRESVRWLGIWGVLHPFADALKLVLKEIIILWDFGMFFLISPVLAFIGSVFFFIIIPIGESVFDFHFILLGFYVLSIFLTICSFFGGISSKNVFAYLGSVRFLSMVFSFELLFCFSFIILLCCMNSVNFYNFLIFQYNFCNFFFLCSIASLLCIVVLAEMNRHPTDLGESEGDLVAGFFIEYSAMSFGLFFMGEYLNMFTICFFLVCLFVGVNFSSVLLPFIVLFGTFLIIAVRGAYPRYRFDAFMEDCWLGLLFVFFGFVCFVFGIHFFIYNVCGLFI